MAHLQKTRNYTIRPEKSVRHLSLVFFERPVDYNAENLVREVAMRLDSVEVSWDTQKSKWLVRLVSGDEVIRRHIAARKDADDPALRTAAQQTVRDEGYEADAAQISIKK